MYLIMYEQGGDCSDYIVVHTTQVEQVRSEIAGLIQDGYTGIKVYPIGNELAWHSIHKVKSSDIHIVGEITDEVP